MQKNPKNIRFNQVPLTKAQAKLVKLVDHLWQVICTDMKEML